MGPLWPKKPGPLAFWFPEFPTPFLYPLSDLTFDGVSSIKLWVVNWFLLILAYIIVYSRKK